MKRLYCVLSILTIIALFSVSASADAFQRVDEPFEAMPLFFEFVYRVPFTEDWDNSVGLNPGTRVRVVGYNDTWAEIESSSGQIGYIDKQDLVCIDRIFEAYTTASVDTTLILDGAFTNYTGIIPKGTKAYAVGYIKSMPSIYVKECYIVTNTSKVNKKSKFFLVEKDKLHVMW